MGKESGNTPGRKVQPSRGGEGRGGALLAYLGARVGLVEDGQRSRDHQAQFLQEQRLMGEIWGACIPPRLIGALAAVLSTSRL